MQTDYKNKGINLLKKGRKGILHAIFSRFGLIMLLLILNMRGLPARNGLYRGNRGGLSGGGCRKQAGDKGKRAQTEVVYEIDGQAA